MKLQHYVVIVKNLVWSDLTVFKQNIVSRIIDITIRVVLSTIVAAYVMPFFGLTNFGLFQFGGLIAAVGLFELYGSVVEFVSDLEGDRVINYNLTLPIPSIFALISKSTYYFIVYTTLTCIMLPIGYVALWGQWELAQTCCYKLILAIVVQSIFYACYVLWAASLINTMAQLGKIWARFIFPMWFMGGFQFSWLSLYKAMPLIAYINAINPMIYITESIRVALLGQTGYVNFWLCLVVVLCFSLFCFAMGFRNLKKRLDFV
jgi:hypothetical protein